MSMGMYTSKDELIDLLTDLTLRVFSFLSANLKDGSVVLTDEQFTLEITRKEVLLYANWEGDCSCIASVDLQEGADINEGALSDILETLCEEGIESVMDC